MKTGIRVYVNIISGEKPRTNLAKFVLNTNGVGMKHLSVPRLSVVPWLVEGNHQNVDTKTLQHPNTDFIKTTVTDKPFRKVPPNFPLNLRL
jgi:hypothetical protein